MENAPATNKPAKSTRSNSSKTKKTKINTKSSKSKSTQATNTSKVTKIINADSASITQQQRQTMIQEMAYLIAERRGFSQGNPTQDWLQAENKVDAQLLSRATEG